MTAPAERLTPRQRDCLRLIYERHATSKEIAIELGISENTVSSYIRDAVELLGARNRREAARIVYGEVPHKNGGDAFQRLPEPPLPRAGDGPSTGASAPSRPWRARGQRNSLTLGQTIGWIAVIAFGSLAALALATSVGNGLPAVAKPIIDAVRRLTR